MPKLLATVRHGPPGPAEGEERWPPTVPTLSFWCLTAAVRREYEQCSQCLAGWLDLMNVEARLEAEIGKCFLAV